MNWDNMKAASLEELSGRIDKRGSADHRESLHNLADTFYQRFPPEDLRHWSVENLYGCVYGLLRFMSGWSSDQAKVRIFNPEIQSHGWESKYTVIVLLCRAMPFCTASVRGELNQRGIRIHSLASCNVSCHRNADGELEAVLAPGSRIQGSQNESLLFFEVSRHMLTLR